MKLLKVLMASATLLLASCQMTEEKAKPEVLSSVQLWGIKKTLKADFEGTLKKVADMGFDGVEFANYFGPYKNDPEGLKNFLDSIGLQTSGAHLPLKKVRGEKFDKVVAFYKTLGADTLIIPMDKRTFSGEKIDEFVAELNEFAVRLKPHGMMTGYHNHWQEFEEYKGSTYWDYVFENTTQDVVMQLDIGWVTYTGRDSVDYVERYPNRMYTTHFKPKHPKELSDEEAHKQGIYAIIGQDNYDWARVIKAGLKTGGTKWFVVEQEAYPNGMSELEALAASKKGFDKYVAELAL